MIRRYDIGREYAHSVGAPAITEQANGAYVRHDDHMALADEWRAEKAGLEQIVMTQEVAIAELREGMEAVGAGGVSPLMGDAKDAEIARLRIALKKCAAVCAGDILNKNGLIDALESAKAALTQQEQL